MRAVREKVSVGCCCSGDQPTVALSVGFRVSPPLFLLILMHALSLSLSPPLHAEFGKWAPSPSVLSFAALSSFYSLLRRKKEKK